MKKYYFLLAAAVATLAFSCAKEQEQENEPVPAKDKTGKVTIVASNPGALDTKVSLTEADDKKAMLLEWEETDALSINGEEFSIDWDSLSDDGKTAEFSGDDPGDGPYTIVYPSSLSDAEGFNARSYTSQSQDGNSVTTALVYNAMLSGVDTYNNIEFNSTWATEHSGSLAQNGVIQMRLQLPEGASQPTSVKLLATSAVFPSTNDASSAKVKEQNLTLSNVTLPEKRILEAYMMFSAAGVTFGSTDALDVIVETSDNTYYRTIDIGSLEEVKRTWVGGQQYTLQCVMRPNSFEIHDAVELEEFRDGVNSGDFLWQHKHVTLANDIDCSSIASWTPIGNGTFTPTETGSVSAEWTEPAFKGTFDGQGHAINNLNMTDSPTEYHPYGLFGILYKATVKNLTLGAVNGDEGKLTVTPTGRMDAGTVAGVAYGATVQDVTNYFPMTIPSNSSPNRVAMAMVGYVYGDAASGYSTLNGLNNNGKVTATQSDANEGNGATCVHVAGIAGMGNTGAASVINQISYCTNYAEIDANTGRCAGVLGAANTRTAISECNNRGYLHNTFNTTRVGGISVILGGSSSISNSHNYERVEVSSSGSGNVGGIVCLVNSETAEISGSSNEGNITGASYVGGIAANISAGTITLCVNTGNITGVAYVGGVVARMGNNNGWPYVNKSRSNATITSTTDGASNAGGIVGQMQGGVLNTCSAKGSVIAAGYDVGGIVGMMYCSNASYGRQYVYDCLAAIDVSTSRTSGAANLGGVVGRIIRHKDITGQYMAIDNCIGLNKTLSAGARNYVGAFVGQVTSNVKTNHSNVRVRNNISLVEDANLNATAATNKGGFVGGLPYGLMQDAYYVVSDNSQTIGGSGNTTTSNITKSDAATLTGSTFCSEHNTRATTYSLTVNSVLYKSSGWVIPTGCSYPVPKTLADLDEDYYK